MITVITASFNGSKYIRQQLDSILSQTRPDIRILVSDDCSSDGSPELLKEYEKEQEGRVLVLQRSYGSGKAAAHFLKLLKLMADHGPGREGELEKDLWEYRELGEKERAFLRELAGAQYFMLSDQDDVWLPHKAQRLWEKMRAVEGEAPGAGKSAGKIGRKSGVHAVGTVALSAVGKGTGRGAAQADRGPGTPVLIHSDLKVVDENLREVAPSFFAYQKIAPERTRLSQLLVQNNVTGGAVMINREMLPFLRRLPQDCLMHDAWLALIASAFGKTGCVKEALYCYRQHGGNALGAEKGDSLESVEARIRDGRPARENYRKMFAQAESFLMLYEDRMTDGQKKILERFIDLQGRCRLEKMYVILRYGFTKNNWFRTLGQMLSI